MPRKITKRLPESKTLCDILPKGAEGGKEFARIVDLLLFRAARRDGTKVTIFSDVAGDYHGLDSFEGDAFRKQGTIGYQYKFVPSPLSSKHRAEIRHSLVRAAHGQEHLKLTKWIVVTPQDLTESSTRSGGGDITWFEGLRQELGLEFEIEHWGHRKLQGLFLEAPALCLYYYPELVPEGSARRESIQETRAKYDESFTELHHRIEFVGMSVYKQEATRGVPMEHIYIPLAATPDTSGIGDADLRHVNPLAFLAPGARHVVLGDPGAGKSTLMRFLALAGLSAPIQRKYGAKPDGRLPVLVILRRYADELKTRRNLPLLDFVRETVQADLSLKGADADFFEYYLQSGQTLLFFDGLDELASSELKQVVRDRIRSLLTAYPGNTALVTSRVVGYEVPFRFEEGEFAHYRLTPLRSPEIKQFVADWYHVRIENPKERKENIEDLVRILEDEAHSAIRELAQNPLLLTIVALVHRIDAVLPDERVILYQKCTETLLNTWHTWKYRGADVQQRGKVERRNRQRIEGIAYWMHTQARGIGRGQRAVVAEADLLAFLSTHIEKTERLRDDDDDARDQAQEFLEFVKRRAGLLIEVGDARYSFVHLTFQEYLTASHIATQSETGGAIEIWARIRAHRSDAAWHEVIRLLLALLKSDEAQQFLVRKILEAATTRPSQGSARLLGGILVDGIEAAEDHLPDITRCLLSAALSTRKADQLRSTVRAIRACASRNAATREAVAAASSHLWQGAAHEDGRVALLLAMVASGWRLREVSARIGPVTAADAPIGWVARFFGERADREGTGEAPGPNWERFVAAMQGAALTSPWDGVVACMSPAVALGISLREAYRTAFRVTVASLLPGPDVPLFLELLAASCLIGRGRRGGSGAVGRDLLRGPARGRASLLAEALDRALGPAWIPERQGPTVSAPDGHSESERVRPEHRVNARWEVALARALTRAARVGGRRPWGWDRPVAWYEYRHWEVRSLWRHRASWPGRDLLGSPRFGQFVADVLCEFFELRPRLHWELALHSVFVPSVAKRMVLTDRETWRAVEDSFGTGQAGEGEVYAASWLLLLDSALSLTEGTKAPDDSPFSGLAAVTADADQPPLRLAHCIRDLSYGDESRRDELAAMVSSSDRAYRRLFEDCLWLPRAEEMEASKPRAKPGRPGRPKAR